MSGDQRIDEAPAETPSDLCEVRLKPGGPILFIAAGALALAPRDVVVAEIRGVEQIAILALTPGQIVERPPELEPAGCVLRPASATDRLAWGRGEATRRDVVAQVEALFAETGVTARVADAWVLPGGGRTVVVCRGAVGDGVALGRLLTSRLGGPVELVEREPGAYGEDWDEIVSGPIGAGLAPDWGELPPPDSPPTVRLRSTDARLPSAQAFIDRLFPPELRPPPRPPGRQRAAAERRDA